jgi:hypothetical protein
VSLPSSCFPHIHAVSYRTVEWWLKRLLRGLLLGHNLFGIELDEHSAICFKLFDRDGESEVVEDEEL